MKLATKISAGYAVLIALMIAVLIYQVSVIYSLQSLNRELSEVNFEAARQVHHLRGDAGAIEEFIQKFFVRGDQGYLQQVKAFQDRFIEDLKALRSLELSQQEAEDTSRLLGLWGAYRLVELPDVLPESTEAQEQLRASHLVQLSQLRSQIESISRAVQDSIAFRVQQATMRGERAQRISLIAATLALAVSVLVSVLIVRSISQRLDQLTTATRAVARGDFSYRLDARGEDDFAQVASAFNSMAQRLNELDQMKKDFVSHVSHELKTPLGSIQETIRLLLEEIPGPLQDRQRRLLELNLQSAQRLSTMIRNLLDLSQIEAGVMEYDFREHDLETIVNRAVSEFEPLLRGKDLRIGTRLSGNGVRVKCDENALLQVVNNLVGNALKFSPQGGEIGIEVRTGSPVENGSTLLCVWDCGPGVPDEHKEKIFNKFYRGHQGKKMAGPGAGLGLTICRSIVQAHGGKIWVEDRPGGGSMFFVLLPTAGHGEKYEVRSAKSEGSPN